MTNCLHSTIVQGREVIGRKVVRGIAVCLAILFFVGCSHFKTSNKTVSLRQMESDITVYEHNIESLIQGLRVLERVQRKAIESSPYDIPISVYRDARQAREEMCSDNEYCKQLQLFLSVLERRLEACKAEKAVFDAWIFADRESLVLPQGAMQSVNE